jgi:hypothetical protein
MEVVCEASEMPISVVKFAPQRSDLLAVGDEAGQVRIMQVEPETAVMQARTPIMPTTFLLSSPNIQHAL